MPVKTSVIGVNEYILNTIDFINKFSTSSEKKLLSFNKILSQLDTKVALLEQKLNSIP